MARKPFLLRIDPGVFAAVERLASAELRSINGQIEYLLRQALQQRGVKLAGEDDGQDATESDKPRK